MEKVKQKTTTYKYNDEYFVDIVEKTINGTPEYDAFLYNEDGGMKMLVVGQRQQDSTYEEFVNMIEAILEDYILAYEDEMDLLERAHYEKYAQENGCEDHHCHCHEEQGEPIEVEVKDGKIVPFKTFITQKTVCADCGCEHNIALVKDDTVNTETYHFDTEMTIGTEDDETYDPNDFILDIEEKKDRYVAWISHKAHCAKLVTYSAKKDKMTKEQFLSAMLDGALELMNLYINNGMHVGGPRHDNE